MESSFFMYNKAIEERNYIKENIEYIKKLYEIDLENVLSISKKLNVKYNNLKIIKISHSSISL